MRQRKQNIQGLITTLVCKNCYATPNQLIDNMCPTCWQYSQEYGKKRPVLNPTDLKNDLEYIEGISVELEEMHKHYSNDKDLQRMISMALQTMEHTKDTMNSRMRDMRMIAKHKSRKK